MAQWTVAERRIISVYIEKFEVIVLHIVAGMLHLVSWSLALNDGDAVVTSGARLRSRNRADCLRACASVRAGFWPMVLVL